MQKKLVIAALCLLLSTQAASSNTVWVELMKAGKQAQNLGEYQKAKKLLLSALRKAEESNDSGLQAQSLLWLARVNGDEGDRKTARKEYSQEIYRINQSMVLMVEAPNGQPLPNNVQLWPEIEYNVMARVFVNDSPDVENLVHGSVSRICGTEMMP